VTDKNPADINMGDLIQSVFLPDGKKEEPAIDEQDRAPSPNELAALEKLAEEAAQLQDELKQKEKDERPAKLKALKAELLGKMLSHGLKELKIFGRPTIEVVTTNSRKPTRKAIIATMEKMDKEHGKENAIKIWNMIPMTPSTSLSIPDPSPPEEDAPY